MQSGKGYARIFPARENGLLSLFGEVNKEEREAEMERGKKGERRERERGEVEKEEKEREEFGRERERRKEKRGREDVKGKGVISEGEWGKRGKEVR